MHYGTPGDEFDNGAAGCVSILAVLAAFLTVVAALLGLAYALL
jgi:hypothetical protein